MTAGRIKNVRASIEEALAHAEEEDKVYFESCNKLVDILEHIWEKDLKIRPLNDKQAKLEAELLLTPQIEVDDMGYSSVKSSIAGVKAQLAPLVNEKKDLFTQFNKECRSVVMLEQDRLKPKYKQE